MFPGHGTRRMTDRQVRVLPDPDSPIRPTISPGRMLRPASLTATTRPSGLSNSTRSPSIVSSGFGATLIAASAQLPVGQAIAQQSGTYAKENHHQAGQRRHPPGGE